MLVLPWSYRTGSASHWPASGTDPRKADLAQPALPSEDSWPGDIRAVSTLPDESLWPGQSIPSAVAVPPDGPPPLKTENQPAVTADLPVPRPLPEESTWPVAMNQTDPPPSLPAHDSSPMESTTDAKPAEDLLSDAQGKAVDEVPWLRLQSRGPIAPVRSLTFTQDGSRLVAAGEDKHTLIWQRDDEMSADSRWQYERTIRWQVHRGPLGHVHAVTAAPDLLAMAGHGAMGGHSEIWLVDPHTGDWRATLVEPDKSQEPRQVITGLQFAHQDGIPRLVASDRQGKITVWTRGENQWNRLVIVPSDSQQYGAEIAEKLEPFRGFSPIAVVGDYAIAPQFTSFASDGTPEWNLVRIPLDGSDPPRLLHPTGPTHHGFVTTIAVAEQPERIATCDGHGQLTIWQLGNNPQFKTVALDGPAFALSLSQNGQRLLVGTTILNAKKKPSWQIWDTTILRNPKQLSYQSTSGPVRACALSPNGQFAAVALDRLVEVHDLHQSPSVPQRLRGAIDVPTRVAFPAQPGKYRLRITCPSSKDPSAATVHIFDTQQVQLSTLEESQKASAIDTKTNEWMEITRFQGGWKFKRDEQKSDVYWLTGGSQGQPRQAKQCRIRFAIQYFGLPTAWT